MAVRLFPRERPEPFQHIAIDEQIPPRTKLIAFGGRLVSLDQIPIKGQGLPLGGETRWIDEPAEPVSEPRLAAERVALVPADGHLRLGRQHQDRSWPDRPR